MSLSVPPHVSATTGSDQSKSNPLCTSHSITASRTTPTECVLVIITGPARNPDSSLQVVPVISPLPFSVNQPAITGSPLVLPRGRIAVTPVRTGPCPTTNGPWPEMIVTCPTSTPATSVIALSGPGVPSNGTPRSRARGFVGCCSASTASAKLLHIIGSSFQVELLRIEYLAQQLQVARGRRIDAPQRRPDPQLPPDTRPHRVGLDAGVQRRQLELAVGPRLEPTFVGDDGDGARARKPQALTAGAVTAVAGAGDEIDVSRKRPGPQLGDHEGAARVDRDLGRGRFR